MDSLLSPNQQLIAYCSMMIVVVLVIALGTTLLLGKIAAVRDAIGEIASLWGHALAELSAIMRHDDDWAQEMDALMDERNTQHVMPPERYARLVILLAERAISEREGLRKGERKAAVAYLAILPLAEIERAHPGKLTGLKVVGTPAPLKQSIADRGAREDAIAH